MIFKKPINWLASTRLGQFMLKSFYRVELDTAYNNIRTQIENSEDLEAIKKTIDDWKRKYTILAFPFRDVCEIADKKGLSDETIDYLKKEGAKPLFKKSNIIVDALNWLATTILGKFILKYFFNTDIDAASKKLSDYLQAKEGETADKKEIENIIHAWKERHSILKFPFRLALHLATVTKNPFAIIKYLLSEGADPNAKDEDNQTPLHRHSYLFDMSKTKEKEYKGEEFRKTSIKYNKRYTAEEQGIFIEEWKKITKLLLEYGADINAKDIKSKTPAYQVVITDGPVEILQNLAENGADFKIENNLKQNILHKAAFWQAHIDVLRYLIKTQGINPNHKDRNGLTALSYALNCRDNDKKEVIKLFKDNNYKFNIQETDLPVLIPPLMKTPYELVLTEIDFLFFNETISRTNLHNALEFLIDEIGLKEMDDLILRAVRARHPLETIQFLVEKGITVNPILPRCWVVNPMLRNYISSPLDYAGYNILASSDQKSYMGEQIYAWLDKHGASHEILYGLNYISPMERIEERMRIYRRDMQIKRHTQNQDPERTLTFLKKQKEELQEKTEKLQQQIIGLETDLNESKGIKVESMSLKISQ